MHVLGVFIIRDQLAATSTASAFVLIGPAVGYAGVCTQAESVHQNCVLGRRACLCSIVVLHLPFFFFVNLVIGNFNVLKEIRILGWVLLHSVG